MQVTPLLLALLLPVAGCGYKAPLYLPGQKPAKGSAPTAPADPVKPPAKPPESP